MDDQKLIYLPRNFWLSALALLIWLGLPAGIYFFVIGYLGVSTFFLLFLGLAALFAILNRQMIRRLESFALVRSRVILGGILWAGVALLEVYHLINSRPIASLGYVFQRIYSAGIIILMGVTMWQLTTAWRSQG